MTTMPFERLRLHDDNFQNPRTRTGLAESDLRELALHIGHHGLLNALLVTQDGLIIAGQRRYHAISILINWRAHFSVGNENGDADLTWAESSLFDNRRNQFLVAVPVCVVSGDLQGMAIADNVLRADLSSYEMAEALAKLSEAGATGRDIARAIGKSTTYVSRKLTAWGKATPELKARWEAGELAEDRVFEIAALSADEQRRVLVGEAAVPGRRGPAGRPSIDTVKRVHEQLVPSIDRSLVIEGESEDFRRGAVEALAWVIGERASRRFAMLLQDDQP